MDVWSPRLEIIRSNDYPKGVNPQVNMVEEMECPLFKGEEIVFARLEKEWLELTNMACVGDMS